MNYGFEGFEGFEDLSLEAKELFNSIDEETIEIAVKYADRREENGKI